MLTHTWVQGFQPKIRSPFQGVVGGYIGLYRDIWGLGVSLSWGYLFECPSNKDHSPLKCLLGWYVVGWASKGGGVGFRDLKGRGLKIGLT